MAQEAVAARALELGKDWKLPDRGKVGIAFLIITESALFTIFVVAYLVYLAKAQRVRSRKMFSDADTFFNLPVFKQCHDCICRASAASERAGSFQAMVGADDRARARVSGFNGA